MHSYQLGTGDTGTLATLAEITLDLGRATHTSYLTSSKSLSFRASISCTYKRVGAVMLATSHFIASTTSEDLYEGPASTQ